MFFLFWTIAISITYGSEVASLLLNIPRHWENIAGEREDDRKHLQQRYRDTFVSLTN